MKNLPKKLTEKGDLVPKEAKAIPSAAKFIVSSFSLSSKSISKVIKNKKRKNFIFRKCI